MRSEQVSDVSRIRVSKLTQGYGQSLCRVGARVPDSKHVRRDHSHEQRRDFFRGPMVTRARGKAPINRINRTHSKRFARGRVRGPRVSVWSACGFSAALVSTLPHLRLSRFSFGHQSLQRENGENLTDLLAHRGTTLARESNRLPSGWP